MIPVNDEEEDESMEVHHNTPTVQLPPISSFDHLLNDTRHSSSIRYISMSSEMRESRDPFLPELSPQAMLREHSVDVLRSPNFTMANNSPQNRNFENSMGLLITTNESDRPKAVTLPAMNVRTPHPAEELQPHLGLPAVNNDPAVLKCRENCLVCPEVYGTPKVYRSIHQRPGQKPHKCPTCDRSFARPNDIQRHQVRHLKEEIVSGYDPTRGPDDRYQSSESPYITTDDASPGNGLTTLLGKRAFRCPYNSVANEKRMDSAETGSALTTCHPTGIFSRRDTYKNHLKALHFKYPSGTRKRDRASVPGKCRHCEQEFNNVDEWLEKHVGK
ncbi:Stp3p LALA0_S01e11100g [Lachancea lanzarotensis]|uniref:pH-response transcription factor pacC/RIM101 n=1 Tax=Lachancea lanzarotensis TaxID=1245769 RepID=A0A0C7N4P5_9SACH|nr:uncharacterized protein LALA0_S01e11100g [Lachancea lanzarotensis]CEP60447.1 LALA0S01e11100g1_1 [Lachancea lanzarotensis]